MKERHRFRPAILGCLEPRVVLSGSVHIAPVTTGHVSTSPRNAATQAVVNNVSASFDSFTTDYLQAQGAYFAAGSTQEARGAFRSYVSQRIDLLAAQLTQIFTHIPGSLNQLQPSTPGGPVILQAFLRTRINGTSERTMRFSLIGRGRNGGAIPPVDTTGTTATATLYTDQAITAINTARIVTLNSVGFLYSNSFKH
jgi:hypothetical protein